MNRTTSDNFILAPLIDDIEIMKMANFISELFEKEFKTNTNFFYVPTSIDYLYISNSLKRQLVGYKLQGPHFQRKVFKKYCSKKKSRLIFSNLMLYNSFKKNKYPVASKEELLKLQMEGILVGDLIYDTYLRFKSKPTVDITDKALADLIMYVAKLATKTNSFLKNNNISAIILTYSTYTHWGIMARLAVKHGIPVYTFGSQNYIFQQLSSHHIFHAKDFFLYPTLFKSDPVFLNYLPIAQKALEKRLTGMVDESIAYMKTSPYTIDENNTFIRKDNSRPFAVIFAHCFFDSPHVYGKMIFPDFYEWLTFLLSEAGKNPEIDFFLKQHPNARNGNDEIIQMISSQFSSPNLHVLPAKTSNLAILQQKPAAIFSVHGTVCHEFAYAGVPVIMSGDNPHSAYQFSYQPKTREELAWYIQNIGKFGLPKSYRKEDIVEFFFMHYMYYSAGYLNIELKNDKNFTTGEIMLNKTASFQQLIYG